MLLEIASKLVPEQITKILGRLTRQGSQTSEFWLTLVAVGLGMVKQFWLVDLPEESFYVVIAYILSRTFLKASGVRK